MIFNAYQAWRLRIISTFKMVTLEYYHADADINVQPKQYSQHLSSTSLF